MSRSTGLSWWGITRLGIVQAMLGAVVVLTTSTLNRVMVVELALPALLPGLLVGLHHAVQLSRPRMGFGSDVGGQRTPWILGGMAVLATGGWLAAVATAWMSQQVAGGLALAVLAFAMVGLGASAAGTSLLVMLAKCVDAPRRAGAAALVWTMMIVGFAVTAGVAGRFLDPYTPARLVAVSAVVSVIAMAATLLALWRLERQGRMVAVAAPADAPMTSLRFRQALAQVWAEPDARRFTVFVFVSMLAFSAQDLILEPFAGLVFGLTPGQTTQLSGVQNGGVLTGMLVVAVFSSGVAGLPRLGSLKAWTIGGCLASALALVGLAVAGASGPPWPLQASVFALGLANGVYAIAAIGSMMALVGRGRARREGVRMGLWGAAQAIAFGAGGLLGTAASDLARLVLGNAVAAYGTVFCIEALLFVVAASLAVRAAGALGEDDQASRPGVRPAGLGLVPPLEEGATR